MPASPRRRCALRLTAALLLFTILGLTTTVALSWLLTRQTRFSTEFVTLCLGRYKFGTPDRWTTVEHGASLGAEDFNCTAHWLRPATMAVPPEMIDAYPTTPDARTPSWVALPSEDTPAIFAHTFAVGWPRPALSMIEFDASIVTGKSIARTYYYKNATGPDMTRGLPLQYPLPLNPLPIGLAIDTLFWGSIWAAIVCLPIITIRRFVRRRRLRRGLCPACAYDRVHNYTVPCPECGLPPFTIPPRSSLKRLLPSKRTLLRTTCLFLFGATLSLALAESLSLRDVKSCAGYSNWIWPRMNPANPAQIASTTYIHLVRYDGFGAVSTHCRTFNDSLTALLKSFEREPNRCDLFVDLLAPRSIRREAIPWLNNLPLPKTDFAEQITHARGWPFLCLYYHYTKTDDTPGAIPLHRTFTMHGAGHSVTQQAALPYRILPLGLAADAAFFASLAALVLFAPALIRRTLRRRRNHCPHCNYPLSNLPAASPCPECGPPLPVRGEDRFQRSAGSR